jgi:leader peptidase (prepilin peptidase)/N-methyltransferase
MIETMSAGWVAAAAAVTGLLIGSFLNVVIHRLPRMLERQWQNDAAAVRGEDQVHTGRYDLMMPRSHCPACGQTLRLRDLIPVASWLALGARCAACQAPIGLRYPLVEIATAMLFVLCAMRFDQAPVAFAAMLLTSVLLAAALIDFDTQLLPDALTLPLLWAGLLVNLNALFVPIDQAVLGAIAGYLSLWFVHHAFRLATGREGMGYGDFKLLAAIGAWLGWQPLAAVVLLACASGAAFAVIGGLAGLRDMRAPIAFGPWLAAAGMIALFTQPVLVHWLLGG